MTNPARTLTAALALAVILWGLCALVVTVVTQ